MSWNFLLIALLLPVIHSLPERRVCANVKNRLGHTEPAGDVYLHHGVDSLDLECIITDPGVLRENPRASDGLRFVRGTTDLDSATIVDGSKIRLHIDADKLDIGSPMYQCLYYNETVCSNVVFVATPPRPKDFRCVSYNNDNFTCSWTHPMNSIPNNYSLFYMVQTQPRMRNHCPDNPPDYDPISDRYFCTWTLNTKPQYRQSSEYYNISFTGENRLGWSPALPARFQHFHHFAHIIPNAPEQLAVHNRTTSSLLLQWSIPPTIRHRGLNYRVMYTCGQDLPDRRPDRDFKLAALGYVRDKRDMVFNLTNLPYAHDLCDVRVALKINLTRDDTMWSANATLFERTAATVPGEGPTLDVGSFKHINNTAVRIYWRQVPAEYENGRDLRYNVTLVSGAGQVRIDRTRTLKNSVVVGNLNPYQNYTFAVYASNDVGAQRTPHAQITILADYLRPSSAELRKIEYARGFKLLWEPRPLKNQIDVVSYTVFWCREITKSINEDCNGNWDWATVPADRMEYTYRDNTTTLNSTSYRVAIASNAHAGSSGMSFPTCEESGEQIPTISLKRPTSFGDTSVTLSWILKCTTDGIANYTIEYCKFEYSRIEPFDCRGKHIHRVDVDGGARKFTVGNLTPYSTYLFTIYPTMKNGNKGKTSEPEPVTTKEGTPTEPLNLNTINVTNSSIALQWEEPRVLNGYILYKVFSNGREEKADLKETTYVVQNLQSYTLYNISVMACTPLNCSEPAKLTRLTLIGTPGKVGQPTATSINTSDILVVWSRPQEPRGPVFYEIKVDDGEENTLTNTSEMYHYKCTHKTTKFSIVVRAVNYDKDKNRTYYGDWSDEFKGNCSPGMGWLIPVVIVLGATIIGTVFLGSRKLYSRCRKMQDIDVKLPATLADPSVWPSPKDPNIREAKPAASADEELLLQTRPDIKSSYVGDSSGCSSAQGSVTSESDGTFSAASDSGTEQGELRKRSFRNSSKTSLLGAEVSTSGGSSVGNVGSGGCVGNIANVGNVGKNENYSQVGIGMGIETNPLAEMDDTSLSGSEYQPYVDVDVRPPMAVRPEVPNSSYVTVAQARSLAKPKEEANANKPYVQVAELKAATQKPPVDTSRSYVTVGQMPPAKLLKED